MEQERPINSVDLLRQLIKSKGENVSWTEYKDAITLRFRSVYDDPMTILKNANYDKSTKEYQDTFDNMLSRVEVSEKHAISLHLGGLPTKLEMSHNGRSGVAKQHELYILIDSSSTHNLLDVNMAKRMRCNIWSTCPLAVYVPGGKQMVTVSECKDFKWKLYGYTFTYDVMLLPLGICCMVLGIQWLSTLGDIRWNFQQLKREFLYNNKRVCLRGTNKFVTHWLDVRKKIVRVETTGGVELMMMTIYPNTRLHLMTIEETVPFKSKVKPRLQEFIDAHDEFDDDRLVVVEQPMQVD
nr:transposon Ty3-I Gag-Pol polyprotein [Tanacetum cinerariifolium]